MMTLSCFTGVFSFQREFLWYRHLTLFNMMDLYLCGFTFATHSFLYPISKLPRPKHKVFPLKFFFVCVILFGCSFIKFLCFTLLFVYSVIQGSDFVLHCGYPIYQHCLLKKLTSPHCVLYTMVTSLDNGCVWLYFWVF